VLLPKYRPDELPAKVEKIVAEAPQAGPGSGGDGYLQRRGVPILSRGVGGAMLHSRPEREVLWLDDRG
jgi:hypothetical protein